jgi:hydroxymethylglutaryl-CoA lyase
VLVLPEHVKIVEVGPRDGLQNEPSPWPTERKLAMVHALGQAGVRHIELTALVSPKAVPQMADAAEVIAGLVLTPGVIYSVLVPNPKGLDRLMAADPERKVSRVAVFTAASDTFNQRNIGMTVAESLTNYVPVVQQALGAGYSVRGYVSTGFVCPYDGDVPIEKVLPVVEALLAMGCDEVSLGDTVGAAVPTEIEATVGYLLNTVPVQKLALHCHDTFGTALANVVAGLALGITTFDSSVGGLGGCPYAPGAKGNLATETLVYALHRMGVATGIDLDRLKATAGGL